MTRYLVFLSMAVAAACGGDDGGPATSPTPPSSDRVFLSFTADAGFGLSPGQSMELTPDNATFSSLAYAFGAGTLNAIQVTAQDATGATWGIWVAAPRDQQLVPGRYANAVGNQSTAPDRPGITFWNTRIAGCFTATGEFRLLEVTYTGRAMPDRFHATFEQRCAFNGQVLSSVRGEVNVPKRLDGSG